MPSKWTRKPRRSMTAPQRGQSTSSVSAPQKQLTQCESIRKASARPQAPHARKTRLWHLGHVATTAWRPMVVPRVEAPGLESFVSPRTWSPSGKCRGGGNSCRHSGQVAASAGTILPHPAHTFVPAGASDRTRWGASAPPGPDADNSIDFGLPNRARPLRGASGRGMTIRSPQSGHGTSQPAPVPSTTRWPPHRGQVNAISTMAMTYAACSFAPPHSHVKTARSARSGLAPATPACVRMRHG